MDYAVGKKRIVTKFLWFPLTIGKVTRWLVTVNILQRLEYGADDWDYGYSTDRTYWRNINFIG